MYGYVYLLFRSMLSLNAMKKKSFVFAHVFFLLWACPLKTKMKSFGKIKQFLIFDTSNTELKVFCVWNKNKNENQYGCGAYFPLIKLHNAIKIDSHTPYIIIVTESTAHRHTHTPCGCTHTHSTNLSTDIFNLHTNYKIGSLPLKGNFDLWLYHNYSQSFLSTCDRK